LLLLLASLPLSPHLRRALLSRALSVSASAPSALSSSRALLVLVMLSAASDTTRGTSGTCRGCGR
jgi:hypothetical protein